MFAFYCGCATAQKGSGVPWVVFLSKYAGKLFHLKFQLHLSPSPPPPSPLMRKEESMHINAFPDHVIYFSMWLAYSGLVVGGMKSLFLQDCFSFCAGTCSLLSSKTRTDLSFSPSLSLSPSLIALIEDKRNCWVIHGGSHYYNVSGIS